MEGLLTETTPADQPEAQTFSQWLMDNSLSENTLKQYLYYLGKLGDYENLDQNKINQFLRRNNNGVARALLRNLREYLLLLPQLPQDKRNLIASLVIRKGRRKMRSLPEQLTIEQIMAIHDALPKERHKIMLLLTYYGALRVGDLLKVSLSSFNWKEWRENESDEGKLRLEKRKRDKTTILPVNRHLMSRVGDWIDRAYPNGVDAKQPLFYMNYNQWHYLLRKASIKALGRPIHTHLLRHAYAMHLKEQGWDLADIREFLGHEDISTTQIYAKSTPGQIARKHVLLPYIDHGTH